MESSSSPSVRRPSRRDPFPGNPVRRPG